MSAPALPLPLAEVVPIARRLAHRTARVQADVDDLVQVALFAYHRTEQRYRKQLGQRRRMRLRPIRSPVSWATVVLRREMQRYYRYQGDNPGPRERVLSNAINIDVAQTIPADVQRQIGIDPERHFGVGLAGQPWGDPEPIDVLHRDHILRQYLRDLERAQGHEVAAVAENLLTPDVKAEDIKISFCFTQRRYYKTLQCIKDFTASWLADRPPVE